MKCMFVTLHSYKVTHENTPGGYHRYVVWSHAQLILYIIMYRTTCMHVSMKSSLEGLLCMIVLMALYSMKFTLIILFTRFACMSTRMRTLPPYSSQYIYTAL